MRRLALAAGWAILLAAPARGQGSAEAREIDTRVEHHFASNDGVRIHYAAMGKGKLVVMIHGFPDFWYTWREQMVALARDYRVVAIDQRGYNQSDAPKEAEAYDMSRLVGDVAAVIRDAGSAQAIVVGHDWGGAVAWSLAMTRPELVEKLVILNLPHPNALVRELQRNPEQAKNSQYARNFQQPNSHARLSAEGLAGWVRDSVARRKYVEAFRRSDLAAMMAYYQRNYPREPYDGTSGFPNAPVKVPVLQIHGLKDTALLPGGLDGTWQWLEQDWTLVTIPNAGHFVQQDAPDLVTRTIRAWLSR